MGDKRAGIEELVTSGLRALFLSDPIRVCNELRALAENSVHKTITYDELVNYLAGQVIGSAASGTRESASGPVHEVTEQYLAGVWKNLIQNTPPARSRAGVVESHRGRCAGWRCSAHWQSWSGKTGCVIECVEALRSQGIRVLAFRLDRLSPVSSTHAFGQQLGLEESPALVLALLPKTMRLCLSWTSWMR